LFFQEAKVIIFFKTSILNYQEFIQKLLLPNILLQLYILTRKRNKVTYLTKKIYMIDIQTTKYSKLLVAKL